MGFRKKKKSVPVYGDPEALFRDLRNRKVEGLLSHQSDILRRYVSEAMDAPDVALELPTGSGKTLVGLLIAEFRRIAKRERVIYLCPTRQLVLQVCEQAERKYGIKATPFVGRIKDFTPGQKDSYLKSSTIAVATYSALFNSNPFFDSSNLIILDDAHASENYVASNWSMDITRKQYPDLYLSILDIFENDIVSSQVDRFRSGDATDPNLKIIEKIPTAKLAEHIGQLQALLDYHVPETDLRYPWSLLSGHLVACHVYLSVEAILIRPLIPPTATHAPFANASQRIYMSATLGLGGDLERITGVRKIKRLPMPSGWDKQGIGRRLFMFPDLSMQRTEVESFCKQIVNEAGRALILVPSETLAEKYKSLFSDRKVYSSSDIEESKDHFVNDDSGVAILANRYDGIDLSGDECRLLIVEGLPKAGNLQEMYFMSRMAASIVLNDRIRTRVIQAVGRCTRSATDFAAVCIIGDGFTDWFMLDEKRSLFHPELQGELKFGSEQSSNLSASEFVENLSVFLEHGEEWDEVDSDILEYRDESTQLPIPGQEKLFSTSAKEVDFQYALWNEDYATCVTLAQDIAASLSGDELKGFRGFWTYVAASACELAFSQFKDRQFSEKAIDLYDRSSKCLPALVWLRTLAARLRKQYELVSESDQIDMHLESNVERIEHLFDSRSYSSANRFEKDVKQIIDGLDSDDNSDAFEESIRRIGELLGFHADNSDGHAAPDPWWISADSLCLVTEAKNDSDRANSVPVKHTRQAASHPLWIRANIRLAEDAEIYAVMITPATTVNKDVPTYAGELGYWQIDEFRKWSKEAIGVMRQLRSTFTGQGNIAWREEVRRKLISKKLTPRAIIETAMRVRLRDVPAA